MKNYGQGPKVIPGGNSLLSKNPELFLPNKWPTYYKEAKGSRITDLDGNSYTDMSTMGVGTNILDIAIEVDNAVQNAISHGNMSSLNCEEEVILAERLVELHPWSEMVRFARTVVKQMQWLCALLERLLGVKR